jgi:hypothetical protein
MKRRSLLNELRSKDQVFHVTAKVTVYADNPQKVVRDIRVPRVGVVEVIKTTTRGVPGHMRLPHVERVQYDKQRIVQVRVHQFDRDSNGKLFMRDFTNVLEKAFRKVSKLLVTQGFDFSLCKIALENGGVDLPIPKGSVSEHMIGRTIREVAKNVRVKFKVTFSSAAPVEDQAFYGTLLGLESSGFGPTNRGRFEALQVNKLKPITIVREPVGPIVRKGPFSIVRKY